MICPGERATTEKHVFTTDDEKKNANNNIDKVENQLNEKLVMVMFRSGKMRQPNGPTSPTFNSMSLTVYRFVFIFIFLPLDFVFIVRSPFKSEPFTLSDVIILLWNFTVSFASSTSSSTINTMNGVEMRITQDMVLI